jgi:Putative prokaryotic signal transducing protein
MAQHAEDGPLPKPAAEDTINDELVEVFDGQDESEAMVIKGLLQSAGIDALISSLDAQQDLYPGVGGVTVRVRAEDAEDAARIIEESRNASSDDEQTTGAA